MKAFLWTLVTLIIISIVAFSGYMFVQGLNGEKSNDKIYSKTENNASSEVAKAQSQNEQIKKLNEQNQIILIQLF